MKIDHHLQLEIVKTLAMSDKPLAFSHLKPGDIENSLLNYHMNKLLAQKIVDKNSHGYTLTVDGARWLNDNGVSLKSKGAVRVSVAMVLENTDGNYLIGQRTGQFGAQINDYLLPSRYYENDVDLSEQIDQLIAAFIPDGKIKYRNEFGFVQIKAVYSDKSLSSLFCLSHCLTEPFAALSPYLHSKYAWYSLAELQTIDHPSAALVRSMVAYTTNTGNQHVTPLFVGK